MARLVGGPAGAQTPGMFGRAKTGGQDRPAVSPRFTLRRPDARKSPGAYLRQVEAASARKIRAQREAEREKRSREESRVSVDELFAGLCRRRFEYAAEYGRLPELSPREYNVFRAAQVNWYMNREWLRLRNELKRDVLRNGAPATPGDIATVNHAEDTRSWECDRYKMDQGFDVSRVPAQAEATDDPTGGKQISWQYEDGTGGSVFLPHVPNEREILDAMPQDVTEGILPEDVVGAIRSAGKPAGPAGQPGAYDYDYQMSQGGYDYQASPLAEAGGAGRLDSRGSSVTLAEDTAYDDNEQDYDDNENADEDDDYDGEYDDEYDDEYEYEYEDGWRERAARAVEYVGLSARGVVRRALRAGPWAAVSVAVAMISIWFVVYGRSTTDVGFVDSDVGSSWLGSLGSLRMPWPNSDRTTGGSRLANKEPSKKSSQNTGIKTYSGRELGSEPVVSKPVSAPPVKPAQPEPEPEPEPQSAQDQVTIQPVGEPVVYPDGVVHPGNHPDLAEHLQVLQQIDERLRALERTVAAEHEELAALKTLRRQMDAKTTSDRQVARELADLRARIEARSAAGHRWYVDKNGDRAENVARPEAGAYIDASLTSAGITPNETFAERVLSKFSSVLGTQDHEHPATAAIAPLHASRRPWRFAGEQGSLALSWDKPVHIAAVGIGGFDPLGSTCDPAELPAHVSVWASVTNSSTRRESRASISQARPHHLTIPDEFVCVARVAPDSPEFNGRRIVAIPDGLSVDTSRLLFVFEANGGSPLATAVSRVLVYGLSA